MRAHIFLLFVIFISAFCFGAAAPNSKLETLTETKNNFVFNNWYHSDKEKWQSPLHRELLFTWYVKMVTGENKAECLKSVAFLRKNGVKYIGCPYSSTTAALRNPPGHRRYYPELAIPPEAINYSWIVRDSKDQLVTWKDQKNRYFLDVGKKEVQDAILNRVIKNAKEIGADFLFLDNWHYQYWAPKDMSKDEWTEKCMSLLKRARELTRKNGLKLVVNTPTPPPRWPEFASYLDGISYELPAHPARVIRKDYYELELSNYEKVMQMGKSIFLYTDKLTKDGKRWDEDGRKVAATAMLVMPKNQPYWGGIYVCPPRYEVWPVGGWPMWPKQLGAPLGDRKWEGDTITRKFEYGSISVTVGENPKFNVSFEY